MFSERSFGLRHFCLASALLWGCQPGEDDTADSGTEADTDVSSDTEADTGSVFDTDTDVDSDSDTSLPEDCDAAGDEDGNGLADCEDSQCMEHELCTEQACAGGDDEDLDGLIDCDDPDCWGHGCAAEVVHFSTGTLRAWRGLSRSVGCDGVEYDFHQGFEVEGRQIAGTFARFSEAGVVSSCTFSVPDLDGRLDRTSWATRSDPVEMVLSRPRAVFGSGCSPDVSLLVPDQAEFTGAEVQFHVGGASVNWYPAGLVAAQTQGMHVPLHSPGRVCNGYQMFGSGEITLDLEGVWVPRVSE